MRVRARVYAYVCMCVYLAISLPSHYHLTTISPAERQARRLRHPSQQQVAALPAHPLAGALGLGLGLAYPLEGTS